jgi:hypothetical protein
MVVIRRFGVSAFGEFRRFVFCAARSRGSEFREPHPRGGPPPVLVDQLEDLLERNVSAN